MIGNELLKQGAQYTIVTQVAMVEISLKLHKGFYCAKEIHIFFKFTNLLSCRSLFFSHSCLVAGYRSTFHV